jgi:polygalacturonase
MKPPTTGNRTAYNNFTINVLEHGARGDGVTDDTPYIEDAIDRLPSTRTWGRRTVRSSTAPA